MWDSLRQSDGDGGRALSERVTSWLADGYIECYVSWREEAAAVQTAYDNWRSAPRSDELIAFSAYRAALDREECAASVFHESVERISAAQRRAA